MLKEQHIQGFLLRLYTDKKNQLLMDFMDAFDTGMSLIRPLNYLTKSTPDLRKIEYLREMYRHQIRRTDNIHIFDLLKLPKVGRHDFNVRLAKWQTEIRRQIESLQVVFATLCCTESSTILDLKRRMLHGYHINLLKLCLDKFDHGIKEVLVRRTKKRARESVPEKEERMPKQIKLITYID